jgi:serine/threonine protein kinase
MDMDLRKLETIHQGKRNLVLKLYDRKTGKKYAWKRYENADEYTSEMAFFMVANHPRIIKAVCTQRDKKTGLPGILMDFAEGGSSLAYAKANAHRPERVIRLLAQMYDVLKYMHWLGFIHADFKPENVMMDRHGDALAIDFGFAIKAPHYRHYRGTPSTMAPELIKAVDGDILENIDTWALGSSIAQLMAYVYPNDDQWESKRGKRLHKWVPVRISKSQGFSFGPLPQRFPEELRQLLYYTMHPQPKMRMLNTKSQLDWFEHLPFWRGIDFDSVGFDWANHSDD